MRVVGECLIAIIASNWPINLQSLDGERLQHHHEVNRLHFLRLKSAAFKIKCT